MKCNLENREDLISKYLLNELSDEEILKFEEHYFTCKDCFNELKAAEHSLNLVTKEGSKAFESVKEKKTKRIFSFIPQFSTTKKYGIAFAVLALLFILYFALKTETTQPSDEKQIITETKTEPEQRVDSLNTQPENPVEPDKDLMLSGPEFNPSPYYEEWINENVRSGNILIDKVIAPKNNDKYLDQSVSFKWRMKENVPVNLVIMNNEEDVIFSTRVSSDSFPEYSLSASQNDFEKSGLYYWRIEDEIEVLYLGKFYFIKKH
ncbi:MAG: zf-HC2 domain-containing protein [Ignavibacterium sp.]|nr:zf-HC2 domain-containing protein [Ignavibacterium sp.]